MRPSAESRAAVRNSGLAAGGGYASGDGVGGGTPAGAPPLAYEQQVVQAKTLVTQDPKRVAQVVKTWVGE